MTDKIVLHRPKKKVWKFITHLRISSKKSFPVTWSHPDWLGAWTEKNEKVAVIAYVIMPRMSKTFARLDHLIKLIDVTKRHQVYRHVQVMMLDESLPHSVRLLMLKKVELFSMHLKAGCPVHFATVNIVKLGRTNGSTEPWTPHAWMSFTDIILYATSKMPRRYITEIIVLMAAIPL